MAQSVVPGFGQPIEYIQDRLYLAAYENEPSHGSASTPPSSSPSKFRRGIRNHLQRPPPKTPVYFTVDDALFYNAFHADFGPFHIGHLYRFAVQFHEILGDPANNDRIVVFWSQPDSRSRANAACLLACYMVLIQSWPPHLALAPIAQADPPFMPFRDAGYSQADYTLSIQDVVYGVWKAKEEGLCELKSFNLEEYETYERVDMGDFNWVTPDFLAFASPQNRPVAPVAKNTPEWAALPKTIQQVVTSNLPTPFKNILSHFASRDIGLVVRLNSELYCPSYFTALGIEHVDMIFEDGTCPALPTVRHFIRLAHQAITNGKGIAVHCKAGLGRTGCLIGSYLIYRHGFTANEVISFMRFMRPGMVVGPQQHWLHLNQGTFRQWWYEDTLKEQLMAQFAAQGLLSSPTTANPAEPVTPGTSSKKYLSGTVTPPLEPINNTKQRGALGEIEANDAEVNATANTHASPVAVHDEKLPAPTPGQPRKGVRGGQPRYQYARSPSGTLSPMQEISSHSASRRKDSSMANSTRRAHQASQKSIAEFEDGDVSDEEIQLQKLASRTRTNSQHHDRHQPQQQQRQQQQQQQQSHRTHNSPRRPTPKPNTQRPTTSHKPTAQNTSDVENYAVDSANDSKSSISTTGSASSANTRAPVPTPMIATIKAKSPGTGILVNKIRKSPRRTAAVTTEGLVGPGTRADPKGIRKVSGRIGSAGSGQRPVKAGGESR